MYMSDQKNDKPEITKVDTPAGLSNEQLFKMFMDSQKQLAVALEKQAEAIKESRKPWEDPRVIEEKRIAAEQRLKEVQFEMRRREATKAQCPHTRTDSDMNGNLMFSDKLNIKWQEHSNGIIKGVCGTCFSEFDTRNPSDLRLLQRDGKSVKNMGRARDNTSRM
jgi:hypothetical protein